MSEALTINRLRAGRYSFSLLEPEKSLEYVKQLIQRLARSPGDYLSAPPTAWHKVISQEHRLSYPVALCVIGQNIYTVSQILGSLGW